MHIPSIYDVGLDWRPVSRCFHNRPDRNWRHWLLDPDSLTERLIAHSQHRFRVEVIEECWWQGSSEYLIKTLGSRLALQRMWSRKVILLGAEEPWVVAHTLVPFRSLETSLGRIRRLKNKPLGAFLFRHPQLLRPSLEIAPTATGWGRCSQFALSGAPVLVAEFFLPELVSTGRN